MNELHVCTACGKRFTRNSKCWSCNRKQRKPKRQGQTAKQAAAHERQSNAERLQDEIAKRLPVQSLTETHPCHRCGRPVIVCNIPDDERRNLKIAPVAVECEHQCVRVKPIVEISIED